MKIFKTKLNDCLIINPSIFPDHRGFFLSHLIKIILKKII